MNRVGAVDASRREQSKAARREAILDAARALIREVGPQVSADKIAHRAGVSTATVYNLIGPREQLLGLLLSELFEDLRATIAVMDQSDPFAVGAAVVTVSAQMFIADSALWLNVLPEVKGAFGARVQPFVTYQPINLQRGAMQTAKRLGMLSRAADAEMTATQIYAVYYGALFLWAAGVLTDGAFLSQAKAGYWAILAALGSGDHRRRAVRELNQVHSALSATQRAEIALDQFKGFN